MKARWIQSIAIYMLFCGNLSIAEDWPHWRGISRNGITQEDSGWDNGSWKTLDVAWKHAIGEGATSPIVVKGWLYTVGWRDGQDSLLCLNSTTGNLIWSKSYQAPKHGRYAVGDQGLYSGPTSTPEYDLATGMLYTRCWRSLEMLGCKSKRKTYLEQKSLWWVWYPDTSDGRPKTATALWSAFVYVDTSSNSVLQQMHPDSLYYDGI